MANNLYSFKTENICDHIIKYDFYVSDINENFMIEIPTKYHVDLSKKIKLVILYNEIPYNHTTYPWEIYKIGTNSYIKFNKFFSLPDTTRITLIFTTFKEKCLKCFGTGLAIDISHNKYGQLNKVSTSDRIIQDIDKYLFSDADPEGISPNIGIDWEYVLSFSDPNQIEYAVKKEIIRNLQYLTNQTSNYNLEDKIQEITKLEVEVDENNPLLINIELDIKVLSQSIVYKKMLDIRNNSFLSY